MPGEPDPLYVRARRALLDAAEALEAGLLRPRAGRPVGGGLVL